MDHQDDVQNFPTFGTHRVFPNGEYHVVMMWMFSSTDFQMSSEFRSNFLHFPHHSAYKFALSAEIVGNDLWIAAFRSTTSNMHGDYLRCGEDNLQVRISVEGTTDANAGGFTRLNYYEYTSFPVNDLIGDRDAVDFCVRFEMLFGEVGEVNCVDPYERFAGDEAGAHRAEDEEMLVVKVGDEIFLLSKEEFTYAPPEFKDVLNTSNGSEMLQLSDMSATTFLDLISYIMYEVFPNEFDVDRILMLYQEAEKFQICDLVTMCYEMILQNMNNEIAHYLMHKFQFIPDSALLKAAMDFRQWNYSAFVNFGDAHYKNERSSGFL